MILGVLNGLFTAVHIGLPFLTQDSPLEKGLCHFGSYVSGRRTKGIYQLDPLGKKQRHEHGGAESAEYGQLAQCFDPAPLTRSQIGRYKGEFY